MKRLILVRHGQAEHNLNGMTGGWTDLALTELGRQQAARAARRVRELVAGQAVSVFCSDLVRAAMTAEAIARELGAEPVRHQGLREFNNGAAAGLTLLAAEKLALPQTGMPFDWQPYPGAETWRTMTARVAACMEALKPSANATSVVVSHGSSGSAIIRWWLGVADLDRYPMTFELDLCSITVLGTSDWAEPTIFCLNDVSHLQGA